MIPTSLPAFSMCLFICGASVLMDMLPVSPPQTELAMGNLEREQ